MKREYLVPPLGLLYLAAVLRREGHEVEFLDLTFSGLPEEAVAARAAAYDLVGLSVSTALLSRAREVIRMLRKAGFTRPIVAGGPHPTHLPEDLLKAGCDAVVVGEGERTLPEWIRVAGEPGRWPSVNGLAFPRDGSIERTPSRPYVENLDDLPFPARDLVDWPAYVSAEMPIVTMLTSRGCPFNCTFCQPMQRELFGRRVRRHSVGRVMEEMSESRALTKLDRFQFLDDSFTHDAGWVEEFCEAILRRKWRLIWSCQSRVNAPVVNRKTLRLMQRAGCETVAFGVESGSQPVLDRLNKGTRVEDSARAFAMCRDIGIHTEAYVIIGTPGETHDDVEKTIALIREIRPYSLTVSVMTPTPGSQLYGEAAKAGIIRVDPENIANYGCASYPLNLEHLTTADMEAYIHEMRTIGRMIQAEEVIRQSLRWRKAWAALRHPLRGMRSVVRLAGYWRRPRLP